MLHPHSNHFDNLLILVDAAFSAIKTAYIQNTFDTFIRSQMLQNDLRIHEHKSHLLPNAITGDVLHTGIM